MAMQRMNELFVRWRRRACGGATRTIKRADARCDQADGPWPTITALHFNTVEELVATTSGPMREGEGAG